jgi:hypothetical protein
LLHGLNPDSEDVGIPVKLLCLSITRYYKWANPVDTPRKLPPGPCFCWPGLCRSLSWQVWCQINDWWKWDPQRAEICWGALNILG